MGSKKILIRIIGLALSLSLVFSGQAGTFHVFAEDMTVENPDSTGSEQGASQDEDYKGALADLGEQNLIRRKHWRKNSKLIIRYP